MKNLDIRIMFNPDTNEYEAYDYTDDALECIDTDSDIAVVSENIAAYLSSNS